MKEHTKEPWMLSGRTVYALNADGCNRFTALVQDAHSPAEELDANARRIVACVNACEGFDTEVLEKTNFMESGYAAEGREFELTKQRDALLAALQFMVDNIAQPVCLETRDGFEAARALLAAAKAGAQ